MSADDVRRQAMARDVGRQLQMLDVDANRIVDRVARRLVLRHQAFGELDLQRLDGWQRWRGRPDDAVDDALLAIAQEIALDDRDREQLHEQARVEMVGGELGGEAG